MKVFSRLIVFLVSVFFTQSIFSDRVVLRDGKELRGKIENQNINAITLNIKGEIHKINKDDIKKIILGNFGDSSVAIVHKPSNKSDSKITKNKRYQEARKLEEDRKKNLMKLFEKPSQPSSIEVSEEKEDGSEYENSEEKEEVLTNNLKTKTNKPLK